VGDFAAQRDGHGPAVINRRFFEPGKGVRGESKVFRKEKLLALLAHGISLVGRATLNFHALHSSRPTSIPNFPDRPTSRPSLNAT